MEVGIPQALSSLDKSFSLPTSRLSLDGNVLDVKLASSQFPDKDDEVEIMLLAMILLQLHGVKLPSSSSSSSSTADADADEDSDIMNKKKRQRTSPDQLAILEQIFQTDKMPNQQTRVQLADQLGMSSRRVQIWFQNKRAKVKRSNVKQDGECSSPNSPSSISSPADSPSTPLSPQSPSTKSPDTTSIITAAITNASSSSSTKSVPSLTVFATSSTPTANDLSQLAETTKHLKSQLHFSLKAPFVETQPLMTATY